MLMGEMSIKLKLRFAFRGYFSRNLKFTFLVSAIIHDIHPLRYCYFLVAHGRKSGYNRKKNNKRGSCDVYLYDSLSAGLGKACGR